MSSIDFKKQYTHAPHDRLDSVEAFEEALSLAVRMAQDDYHNGLVRVTSTGTEPHRSRVRTGHDVARLIGLVSWNSSQERALMATYRGTLTMLDLYA